VGACGSGGEKNNSRHFKNVQSTNPIETKPGETLSKNENHVHARAKAKLRQVGVQSRAQWYSGTGVAEHRNIKT